ncbi:type II toxin-antitoxin system CcdA family antitoxin [Sphingomonas sp. R86521]|uniref:type II toxin-antitoxin system CcdA family antitoxin n=1 Tax=Sphingomonas sp. R86521 TaxID=3093860 RepID=UPI0036D364D8
MATSIDHPAEPCAPRSPRNFAAEANALGLNVAGMDTDMLRRAVGAERSRQFYAANREWVDAHNAWIEQHGLPLADLRIL